MKLSITLIHNKTDEENEQQIHDLLDRLVEVQDGPFFDEVSKTEYFTTHHELKDLDFPHEIRVYQVVPYGVTPPPSRYLINSGGIVMFGAGDEDKVGNHPRFFNWAVKRGTDNGAEVAVVVESVKELDTEVLAASLNSLADPSDKHELVEDRGVKVVSAKLLREVGQLDEKKTIDQALTDYRGRTERKGLKIG